MILNDRRVGITVLETARGGIIRSRLGYSSSRVEHVFMSDAYPTFGAFLEQTAAVSDWKK